LDVVCLFSLETERLAQVVKGQTDTSEMAEALADETATLTGVINSIPQSIQINAKTIPCNRS
jgi:hypothetical protein